MSRDTINMLFPTIALFTAATLASALTIEKRYVYTPSQNDSIIHSLGNATENANVTIYINSTAWGCEHGDRRCYSDSTGNSTQLCVAGTWISYGCPQGHDCIPNNFACSPTDRIDEANQGNDLPLYSAVAVNVTKNDSHEICIEGLGELVTFDYDGQCGKPFGDTFEALQWQVTPCLHGSQRCGDGYSELCSYGVWLRSWCESSAQCLSPTFECFVISDIESCIVNARRNNPVGIQAPVVPPPKTVTVPLTTRLVSTTLVTFPTALPASTTLVTFPTALPVSTTLVTFPTALPVSTTLVTFPTATSTPVA